MPRFLFGRETKIEKRVRRELKKFRIRYRQNCTLKNKGGNSDFIIDVCDPETKEKVSELVIECNGGAIHAPITEKRHLIKDREDLTDIQRENIDRDKRKMIVLDGMYNYLILWEDFINKRTFAKEFKKIYEEAVSKILSGERVQRII